MIKIANPIYDPNWNLKLLNHPTSTIFHTSNWAKTIHRSYGYNPVYFISGNDDLNLFPFMEIKNWINKNKLVSLPFTDNIHPLISNPCVIPDLRIAISQFAKKNKIKVIEWRNEFELFEESKCFEEFYSHKLDLRTNHETIQSNMKSNTIRNIKKAQKCGIKIDINTTFNGLDKYYKLHCLTRKRHGLPPQPFYFFENLFKYVINENMGVTVLANLDEKPIAGAIFLFFNNKAILKYGASDFTYQNYRANNLLFAEGINWLSQKGFKSLDFGRTDITNAGLRKFKLGFGSKESTIKYYAYNIANEKFINNSTLKHTKSKITSHIPIPVLKLIGRALYKYMA